MTGRTLRLWIELEDKSYGVDVETVFSSGGSGKCVIRRRTHELNWGYKIDISTSPKIRRKDPEEIS
jgi:hypothetical protein